MPDTVTQEQLEALRKQAEELREDEALARAELDESEAGKARAFEAKQLLVEITRLEASAAAARARVEASKDAGTTAAVDDALDRDLKAALAALESPQGVPVDTNAGVETEQAEATEPGAASDPSTVGVLEPVVEPETPQEQAGETDEPEGDVAPPTVSDVFGTEFSNPTTDDEPESEVTGDESDTEQGDESDDQNGGSI